MNSSKKQNNQEQAPAVDNKKIRYIKFGIIALLYALWVLWVGSWWLIFGLGVIFDIYITKKINWTPWKKRHQKNGIIIEWIDALIFAVLAVTFINVFFFQNYKIPTGSMEGTLQKGDFLYVTKTKYGPKIPNTPLSFPFTQHTLPLTQNTPSYLEWIKLGHKRLAGFTTIKNNDIVVFNFPEGDTVVAVPLEMQTASYYTHLRNKVFELKNYDKYYKKALKTDEQYLAEARNIFWDKNYFDIAIRPIDRRDNYIKRCVAIPGDTLSVIDGYVFINGKKQNDIDKLQFKYRVVTDGTLFSNKNFIKMGIYLDEVAQDNRGLYELFLNKENYEAIKSYSFVKSVDRLIKHAGYYEYNVFPHDTAYKWNEDQFGPLWIPKKGVTIPIDIHNLCIYQRIIDVYEENKLEVKDSQIFINDQLATTYTFKMDYYFMIGDNRHNSADSRIWGFVPEDHIVGAPKFIWLSLDPQKSFPSNIRWKRLFTSANKL